MQDLSFTTQPSFPFFLAKVPLNFISKATASPFYHAIWVEWAPPPLHGWSLSCSSQWAHETMGANVCWSFWEQLLPYTSATAIGSFLEKYGMTVRGLEQLQPFYKCEGQNLDLPRGSHVNEGRAEKQRKTGPHWHHLSHYFRPHLKPALSEFLVI